PLPSDKMKLAARSEQHLGTVVEIKLPASHTSLFSQCFLEFARIEKKFSRFLPSSELSRANSNLGVWQEASEELLFLVRSAEDFRIKTNGAFDITIKQRLEELGYGPKHKASQNIIQKMRSLLLPPIKIDNGSKRILLNKEIDLGGLGKGYAIDKVAYLLESKGVSHYYINAGGDIYAKSKKGEPNWSILLEHPDDPERAIGKISINSMAIAASAANRRKWGRFHHLINPKTLLPAKNMKACFVLAKSAMEADAYATALFCAGFQEAIHLCNKLGLTALLISNDNKMYQTPGFSAEFFG
ncbi:MAG: FAD:protein FMN transferase, partial [Candidatus Anstonellaceae archaeon]